MHRPSLLQHVFNLPSTRYARHSESRVEDDGELRHRSLSVQREPPLQSLTSHSDRSALRAPNSALLPIPQPHPVDNDDDDVNDLFVTPPTTPTPSPHGSPRTEAFLPCVVAMDEHAHPTRHARRPTSASASSMSSLRVSQDEFSSYSWARTASSMTSEEAEPQSKSVVHSFPRRRSAHAQPAWAKDVRWLAPAPVASTSSAHRPSSTRSYSSTVPAPRKSRARMSALMEESGEEGADDYTELWQRQRVNSAPRPLRLSSSTSSRRIVELPTTLATSAGSVSSTGFTSLVLPLAAYSPAKDASQYLLSKKVDLTRSGIAQTTMSTISITQHAASISPSPRARRFSMSALRGASRSTSSLQSAASMPAHLRSASPSPLAFTARTPPPAKLQTSHVLVQVSAVAIDHLDALLVAEKAQRQEGFDWVPGRGFAGRVVESGLDVSNFSRGDWVFGLLGVKKCGALAEFIAIDRRRVWHVPQPPQPQPVSHSRRHCDSLPPSPRPRLTVEQIAFLALAGVPAHRAVRAVAHCISGSTAPNRKCALVLQAHDGAGLLAVQELTSLGVRVTAQVPAYQAGDEEGGEEQDTLAAFARAAGAVTVLVGEPGEVIRDLAEAIECGWGPEGETEFACVIDTAGGKALWDMSAAVLCDGGQFVTTVGDVRDAGVSALSAGAHFKHNLRALTRAFVQTRTPATRRSAPSLSRRNSLAPSLGRNATCEASPSQSPGSSAASSRRSSASSHTTPASSTGCESPAPPARARATKKRVGYVWISPATDLDAEGADVRDSLAAVAYLVETGVLRPDLAGGWDRDTQTANAAALQAASRSSSGASLSTIDSGETFNVERVNVLATGGRLLPFEKAPEALWHNAPGGGRVPFSNGAIAVVRVLG